MKVGKSQKWFPEPETDGHFSGSIDGVVWGVPGYPDIPHLLEIKTSKASYWRSLEKHGVAKAVPAHYAQMQTYMRWAGLTRALYVSANKDTDELYIERVKYDEKASLACLDVAKAVIYSHDPLPKISEDPKWFECRWCSAHSICHGEEIPPPHCRNCVQATPIADGRWSCEAGGPIDDGLCDRHAMLPSLVKKCRVVDATSGGIVYAVDGAEGRRFYNGDPAKCPPDLPRVNSADLSAAVSVELEV